MRDLSVYDDVLTVEIRGVTVPIWRFIEKFLWIKDKNSQLVRFKLNWAQRELYAEICEQKLHHKPMRADILKARQLGLSTLIAGIIFVQGMYVPNSRWCVIADVKDHAENIFKMYQTFYNNLNHSLPNEMEIEDYPLTHNGMKHPDDLKPKLATSRKGKVYQTESGDSMIEVIVAGDNSGRSATYTGVHSSETAFQKGLNDINVSLFSAVPITNPDSMIFIETTANGYNAYKEMWDRDASGNSIFNALFLPWHKNPDYKLPVVGKMPVMELWIYEKAKRHPEITDEQLLWYWQTYQQGYTKDKMLQEYPWDASDAFVNSGHSIFDMELLTRRMDEIRELDKEYGRYGKEVRFSPDGMSIRLTPKGFQKAQNGAWRVYKKPINGRHYVAVCDPNKGLGTDYSAIQILDQNSGEEMAVYGSKSDYLDEVAYQLVCGAIDYNNALISVENNTGTIILDTIVKIGYPNVYREQTTVSDNVNMAIGMGLGHNTNVMTRDTMIRQMQIAFKDNPNIINDYETAVQMQNFQYVTTANGGIKAMGAGTAHDDYVMAYVPFWKVRVQQRFDIDVKNDVQRREMTAEMLEDMLEKRAEKRKGKDNSRAVAHLSF